MVSFRNGVEGGRKVQFNLFVVLVTRVCLHLLFHATSLGSCTNIGLMHAGNRSMEDLVSTEYIPPNNYYFGGDRIDLRNV